MSFLKNEIKKIDKKKELIIPADKTSNNYLVPTDEYKELVNKEIHKKYKNADLNEVKKVSSDHAQLVEELDLGDRVFKTAPRDCFVT